MGKHYFEFLEEEYQRLTSDVQEALKQRAIILGQQSALSSSPSPPTATSMKTREIDVLFSRCYAVYQQMNSEVGKAKREAPGLGHEFQDRLHLYSVQIAALQDNHRQTTTELNKQQKQAQGSPTEEIVFDFDVNA